MALGERDPDVMMAGMSMPTFLEWLAYSKIEPFGEERGDIRSAIVAQTIAACHAPRGKRYQLRDFMPRFEPPRHQSPDEILGMFLANLKVQKNG